MIDGARNGYIYRVILSLGVSGVWLSGFIGLTFGQIEWRHGIQQLDGTRVLDGFYDVKSGFVKKRKGWIVGLFC